MAAGRRLIDDDARRLAAWARLRELCPPGWTVQDDRLAPVQTPRGYFLRRQTLTAGCARGDCRRRCELDFADLVRSPLADSALEVVVHRLRCDHWGGCLFELRPPTYPEGVPLICYLDAPGVLFEIGCVKAGCVVQRLTPEQVIRSLMVAGRGDGGVGIHVLGSRIRGPCPGCGGTRFTATLLQPPALGTPGHPGGASA